VNENIANLLLTAKFGVPICLHADGVGLCAIVHHLSMSDYVALSGGARRQLKWIYHLHEWHPGRLGVTARPTVGEPGAPNTRRLRPVRRPLAATALQFTVCHPAVTAAVVGVRTPAKITADTTYLSVPIPTRCGSS
jgi:hypothetical protein